MLGFGNPAVSKVQSPWSQGSSRPGGREERQVEIDYLPVIYTDQWQREKGLINPVGR